VAGMIRLTVPAGKAAPAPPVGPALGQKVLDILSLARALCVCVCVCLWVFFLSLSPLPPLSLPNAVK
jgi:hypothetical protein